MNLKDTPPLDRTTIEHGLKMFPSACPNPSDTEREIWMKVGERRAMEKLKSMLDKQERKSTSGVPA